MQIGDVNTRRIFSFQEKAPAAPESHQNPWVLYTFVDFIRKAIQILNIQKRKVLLLLIFQTPITRLRVVYSIKTPMSTKSGSRYIPTSPERILDAPDIINDYCK